MAEEPEAAGITIEIDAERCIGCLECVDVCPQSRNSEFPVYKAGDNGPEIANPDSCIACLSCEAQCRAMAIKIAEGIAVRTPSIRGEARAENKNRAIF
jgi:NAD-dependent dihydropyrimidine dehydrogenase PreA subunit